MKYESFYKAALIVLLSAILVVQVLILSRMPQAALKPPTLGDLRNAKGEQRRELLLGLPIVHVQGSVDVSGSVNINNEPLQVQIVR